MNNQLKHKESDKNDDYFAFRKENKKQYRKMKFS